MAGGSVGIPTALGLGRRCSHVCHAPGAGSVLVGPALAAQLLHGPVLVGRLVGAMVGSVFCVGVAILPPVLVRKRISLIGEEGV